MNYYTIVLMSYCEFIIMYTHACTHVQTQTSTTSAVVHFNERGFLLFLSAYLAGGGQRPHNSIPTNCGDYIILITLQTTQVEHSKPGLAPTDSFFGIPVLFGFNHCTRKAPVSLWSQLWKLIPQGPQPPTACLAHPMFVGTNCNA